MAAWALAVLQGLTPELWAATLSFLAACPEDSWDEVSWPALRLPGCHHRSILSNHPLPLPCRRWR